MSRSISERPPACGRAQVRTFMCRLRDLSEGLHVEPVGAALPSRTKVSNVEMGRVMEGPYYSKEDVTRILNKRIIEAGSVREFCALHDLNDLSVSDSIRFNRVEGKVLEALGLREVKVYERAD